MIRLSDLSYRVKIPLVIVTVIVLTELVVTAALVTRAVGDSRRDLEAGATNLATVLARSLREPILRDDVWQAFEVIRTPLVARLPDNPLHAVVVLDVHRRVLVSTDPRRIPITAGLQALPPALRVLAEDVGDAEDVAAGATAAFRFAREPIDGEYGAIARIVAVDGSTIGAVLLAFDAEREGERVRAAIAGIALVSVPGMLLLIPLGWFWGKRIAEPLARLAQALVNVGRQPTDALAAGLPPVSQDEIGRLAGAARTMLDGLARKEALEREMVSAERLAAVGRVSAAIAHEINNPLGGMLNTVDTLEKHGRPDAFTLKLLGLLQRGLRQVQATVGALLVEARHDSPDLGLSDWHDLRRLVEPQAAARQLALRWRVAGDGGHLPDDPERAAGIWPMPLPAHQVRQLVLNLLLNAIKAAPTGGTVELSAERPAGALRILVANTGAPIDPELRERLFEPFVAGVEADGRRSHGLGLWVCYQIVQQLRGSIVIDSLGGWTRFALTLPIEPPGEAPGPETTERGRWDRSA